MSRWITHAKKSVTSHQYFCFMCILQCSCCSVVTCTLNDNYVTVERVLREDIFFIVAPLSVENDPLTRAILEMGKETYKEHHGAPADDDGDLC